MNPALARCIVGSLRVTGPCQEPLARLGNFGRHTPFSIAFWMRDSRTEDPDATSSAAVVFQACSGTDTGPHGYDLLIEKGHLTARLFRQPSPGDYGSVIEGMAAELARCRRGADITSSVRPR